MKNIQSYLKLCNQLWGLAGRYVTQLGPPKCIVLIVHILPPPKWLTIWYARRATYTECCVTIPQNTVSLSLSVVIHLITSSATSSLFFFLPWERVCWTLLGCHYASFLTRSLGFLELFSNSPLSLSGCLPWGPASCPAITRTIWSE